MDANPAKKAFYTKVYQETARDLDRRGIGGIKAWFCGARSPLKNKKPQTEYTWAIFSDTKPVGQVERNYLVDPLARPRPLVVAGRFEHYDFNFTTRILEIGLQPDASLGNTEVFVSADRFYPVGFRVGIGAGLVMALNPGDKQLSIVNCADESDRQQAQRIRLEADRLQLVMEKWAVSKPEPAMKIIPIPGSWPPPKASQ